MEPRALMEHEILREQIDRLIECGDATRAQSLLANLWRQDPGPAVAAFVLSRFDKLRTNLVAVSCRTAILRSFTMEPISPLLRAAAAVNGIDLIIQIGAFNAYAQEMLDENSSLYRFAPDLVILAVQTRDVAPELWNNFASLSPREVTAAIEQVIASFRSWILAFRSQCKAHLILHTLEMPPRSSQGVLDAQLETSQLQAIHQINDELCRLARNCPGVYMLDYDALVARHGRTRWHDESKWLAMRMPIAADCLIHLANEWLRFIQPLIGKMCKALVVDLDNTLWGGVIGEDGMSGIKLGSEYPGAAYQALQRAILDLYHRGIILAICSKNNLSDAMEVIERHRGMILRPEHFAALRINWNDKARNLKEIAAELNIGIDTLAFLDDNPAEREWIRTQLPEVTVIELTSNPMEYARAVHDNPVFERLTLSAEDRERGRYYSEERLRTELKQSATSLEDFYHSLMMEAEISSVTPETLPRVAQLTQKTNQFNLTTRRYSEQQIAEMAADRNWQVYSIQVRDRFGDNGLVGVAITHYQGRVCEIDTFLMSCRVIDRAVETALLATVADQARTADAQWLVGWFLATKMNVPAKAFYPSHGFSCTLDQNGQSRWEFDLTCGQIAPPPWIKRHLLLGGTAQ
jgi:FkbH-like protein